MAYVKACKACNADNQEEINLACAKVASGQDNWKNVAKRYGFSNGNSLKLHHEKHVVPSTDIVADDMDDEYMKHLTRLRNPVIEALSTEMQFQPTMLQPNYLVAIYNLMKLEQTKPSSQHLVNALKAIQEITGMSLENQMLMSYAQAQFSESGDDVPALSGVIIDMEDEDGEEEDD